MADSLFTDVKIAQPIEVFALTGKYNQDEDPRKVNLGVGAYRTDEGKPWVLPVVQEVEQQMATDGTLNHEYLPVAGLKSFSENAAKLLLGADCDAIKQNRTVGIQALGGTGAIKLAAEFMRRQLNLDTAYVSNPTWGNHKKIFTDAHFTNICEYRFWDAGNRSLDSAGMLQDLKNAPERACVILHGCAHNPTGVDPTPEQWEAIANVCEENKLVVLVDIAYQGFATGDLNEDATAVRYLERRGMEMFIAQSFSKNFGLYNERVGNLVVVTKDNSAPARIKSQIELISRSMWSNPPNHGARIISLVLEDPKKFKDWTENVKTMAERIIQMRQELYKALMELKTPGTWTHITSQKGMFSYTGLTEKEVETLQSKYRIYMLKSGRINMCGLTRKTVRYVAESIHSVVTEQQSQTSN